MAWCANAVESQVVSAINFNNKQAGTLSIVAEDEEGRDSESGRYYWETDATEISSTIKAKKENDDSDKYLAVDETVPLYRTMNGHDANTDAATGTSLIGTNVYFTADVQFTASDETSGAGMVTSGDKLLVWLRATEAVEADPDNNKDAVPATTNLIITAAATDAGTAATDYIVDYSDVINPAQWYTLTIKAVQGGTEGFEAAAFTVELNGTQLSATAEDASEAKTTFNSLVPYTDGAATTITSVGFKGTGSLDNLVFGTFTEDVQKCTVIVSVTGEAQMMAGLSVDEKTVEAEELPYEKEYTIASGAKSTIVVNVEDGYVVTYNNTTYNPDDNGNCTIEIDLSAAEPNVNVVLAVVKAGSEPTTNFPSAWNGGVEPSAAILAKYETWAASNDPTAVNAENAFLLGVASNAEDKTLAVTTIVVEGGTVKITSNRNLKDVNGVPYILTGDAPNAVNTPAESTVDAAGNIQYTPVEGETKKFYKIGVGYVDPFTQE